MKLIIYATLIVAFSTLESLPINQEIHEDDFDAEIPEFPDYNNPTTGNANEFLDKTFLNTKPLFVEKKLDPLSVPGFQHSFQTKIWGFIPVSGHFTAKSGQLSGLSSLHRTGDATILTEDGNLVVRAELGVKRLTYLADCALRFVLPFNLRQMSATIDFLSAYFEVSVPMDKGFHPKATDFKFRDVGSVDVKFDKNGWPFDSIYGAVARRTLNSIKHTIVDTAQPHILRALNEALATLKDPKLT